MDKTAEIRAWANGEREFLDVYRTVEYLLSELERVTQERDEARNSCSVIESFWLAKQEENQRLQQERDEIKKYHDIGFANFRSVLAERDTAIEALRWYANPPEDEMGEHARRTLKELGVIE